MLINNRLYNIENSLADDLALAPAKNYLFKLDYLNCLSLSGDKSSEFLQGQLTCDVRNVDKQHIEQGALCSIKGRIIALMDIFFWQGLKVLLPQDLFNITLNSLNLAARLSQVELSCENKFVVYGFYLQNKEDLLPEFFQEALKAKQFSQHENLAFYSLNPQLYIFIVKQEINADFTKDFIAARQVHGSLTWHWLQLQNKFMEIYPSTSNLFLPHRLGLQNLGYLDFNKGCYRGQEIIARTHYLAKQKYSTELIQIASCVCPKADEPLILASNQSEIGRIIDYCPLSETKFLVLVSKLIDVGILDNEIQLSNNIVRVEKIIY